MSAYSPFAKELTELTVHDLVALAEAAEGWYLEYKAESPSSSSIAKSISAFANTYGGWLFYGVREKSKEQPVAGDFPGIPRSEVDPLLQRMRQASANHVTPSPHFDFTVLWGPCEPIKLTEDRAVICIRVPWSPIAPHVHKDGRIYRRVSDGSEPKPESDRFVLDQLWRRADDIRKEYERWIDKDPEFSEGEDETPYVRLLLVADLWNDRDPWLDVSLDEVRAILGASEGTITAVPFDTVYTTSPGFIGRQVRNNDPHNLGLTWHFRQNLRSEVLIPLNFHNIEDIRLTRVALHGYGGAAEYEQTLVAHGYRTPRILDLNYLFNVLIGVVEIQRRLLKRAGWNDPYFCKARLLNVWRMCPFLDVPAVLVRFREHGIPMCLNSVVTSPAGTDPGTFLEVPTFAQGPEELEEYHRVILQAIMIFGPIARAFGVPDWLDRNLATDEPAYHEDLQQAGRRAIKVQEARIASSRK